MRGFTSRWAPRASAKGITTKPRLISRSACSCSPNFAEAQNYLGYMWAEHGIKLDQARDLITKALKAEPNQYRLPRQHGVGALEA